MTEKISKFRHEFHFLSNFHLTPVLYDGIVWCSSEHAYQAASLKDENQRLNIALLEMPSEVKAYAKACTRKPNWDSVKLDYMEEIVRAKFVQNKELAEKLLATEDLILEEGNTWGDTFWGVCRGKGQNHLGKILMKIREELRSDESQ